MMIVFAMLKSDSLAVGIIGYSSGTAKQISQMQFRFFSPLTPVSTRQEGTLTHVANRRPREKSTPANSRHDLDTQAQSRGAENCFLIHLETAELVLHRKYFGLRI